MWFRVGRALSDRSFCTLAGAVDLHAEVLRRNSGRSMVVLHGLFGSISNWREVGKSIAQRCEVDVHLLDMRNHGRSPHTERMDYPLMALDVLKYAEREKLGSFVLMGHSMVRGVGGSVELGAERGVDVGRVAKGGKTAMLFASRYPELVEKLVVVDISPVNGGARSVELQLDIMRKLKRIDVKRVGSLREADEVCKRYIDVRGEWGVCVCFFFAGLRGS
ncbi:protein ABHD11-like [Schistocerca gregaria]|uniref:protein ABHD11-like n=1 Tax=Schistocerca gregaria TaxID=7010 RepID=UPI00211F3CE0|nr:protein ABHD11-like [Schistocerca gregaria]